MEPEEKEVEETEEGESAWTITTSDELFDLLEEAESFQLYVPLTTEPETGIWLDINRRQASAFAEELHNLTGTVATAWDEDDEEALLINGIEADE